MGYALALFGLIVMGLIAYSASRQEIESADWVARAQEVIASLESIQRTELDAE